MTVGCLTVTVDRIGGASASMTRATEPATATATRVGGMTANLGLVCATSLGVGCILWASDAKLITVDRGVLLVMDK